MAKCKFSITFTGNAEDLILKAREAISGAGGNFEGNTNDGNFKLNTGIGSVSGSYIIDGNILQVEIHQKPVLVSCNRIEQELTKHLGE